MTKRILRQVQVAVLAVLVAGLAGCKTTHSIDDQDSVTKQFGLETMHEGYLVVGMPEETLAVVEDTKVLFSVFPNPDKGDTQWNYQWQKDGAAIKGETKRFFAGNFQLKNTGKYRCMIYRAGEFGETNYTTETIVTVTQKSILMALTPSLTTGPLQPGTWLNNKSDCWCEHNGYARFKSPNANSYWWSPASTAQATITDVSNGAPTSNRRIDVMESGSFKHWCDTDFTGKISFPVKSTCKYQFIVYIKDTNSPPDSLNETITLKVDGLK